MRRALAVSSVIVAAASASCGGAEAGASSPPTASDGSSPPPACVASVALPDPTPPPTTHAECLADTSAFDASWKLMDDAWCVVARYDMPAAVTPGHTLTWGRHGGPLQGGSTITRWSPPAGSTGTMTATTEAVRATPPDGMSWNDWAVDLPFDDWTVLGAARGGTLGSGAALVVLQDGEERARIDADAIVTPVGIVDGDEGRIVFENVVQTGSEPPQSITIQGADCAASTCDSPFVVEAPTIYNDSPFGMFADPSGNVFAALEEGRGAEGTYEQVRAFGRSLIAPRVCPPAIGATAEINGNIMPAADGDRIYYGAREYDQGIETLEYRLDPAGAITFGTYASFVTPVPSTGGWYFGALLIDDRGRLWAANVVDKSVTFWVFARR